MSIERALQQVSDFSVVLMPGEVNRCYLYPKSENPDVLEGRAGRWIGYGDSLVGLEEAIGRARDFVPPDLIPQAAEPRGLGARLQDAGISCFLAICLGYGSCHAFAGGLSAIPLPRLGSPLDALLVLQPMMMMTIGFTGGFMTLAALIHAGWALAHK